MRGGRTVELREATPDDAAAIAQLFFETVRRINSRDYDARQIYAWAGSAPEVERWSRRIAHVRTIVAILDGEIAGFAGFEPDGHLDTLFVHHVHQGVGIASCLLDRIEEEATALDLDLLYTEASITARPFFERKGFRVITPQRVELRGSTFANFRMEKMLERGSTS